MQQLDTPVVEAPISECPPEGAMSMAPMEKSDAPEPSMSVNLNAQGLDNIADILKLVAKVNPDTVEPQGISAPAIEIEPMDKPANPLGALGNLDSGPLKMLPDFDKDNDNMPGGEHDMIPEPIDQDGEEDGEADNDEDESRYSAAEYGGEHDEDPIGGNKPQNPFPFGDDEEGSEEDDEENEAFGNSVNGSEPEYGGIDDVVRDGDDLNKPKKSFSDKPYRGDNPMATEGTDLRAQIRAELLRRLNEAKGAK